MPYCVFKGCQNNSQNQKRHDGISFHRFPIDPNLRQQWVSIARKSRKDETWTAPKLCFICSAHFKEEDIFLKGKKGYRCLKKHAKPQLVVEKAIREKTTHQEARPSEEKTTDEKIAHQETELPERAPDTDDFDDNDSDQESMFDIFQKYRVRMEIRRQKLLNVVNKKKIQTLQQKVRQLKKKNASLKQYILKLETVKNAKVDVRRQKTVFQKTGTGG